LTPIAKPAIVVKAVTIDAAKLRYSEPKLKLTTRATPRKETITMYKIKTLQSIAGSSSKTGLTDMLITPSNPDHVHWDTSARLALSSLCILGIHKFV
jgi:hypothetical protein